MRVCCTTAFAGPSGVGQLPRRPLGRRPRGRTRTGTRTTAVPDREEFSQAGRRLLIEAASNWISPIGSHSPSPWLQRSTPSGTCFPRAARSAGVGQSLDCHAMTPSSGSNQSTIRGSRWLAASAAGISFSGVLNVHHDQTPSSDLRWHVRQARAAKVRDTSVVPLASSGSAVSAVVGELDSPSSFITWRWRVRFPMDSRPSARHFMLAANLAHSCPRGYGFRVESKGQP